MTLDIPDAPLPQAEFYAPLRRRAAGLVAGGARLGLLPPLRGAGLRLGAADQPPPLDRHAPLIAGEHALYYDVEPGGLTRAVKAALADKERLARIAAAAQAHVMAHHTPAALARYVVETARAL